MKNILQNIELDIEDNQTYILRIKIEEWSFRFI